METVISNYEIYTEAKRGGRNYMEDVLCVTVPKTEELGGPKNGSLMYLAVFDGHGGPQAAEFAKEHLLNEITKQKGFWSDDDSQVTRAIKDGFLSTHKLMWTAVDSWPKTNSGLQSTAGTTASVVLIKGKKMYIAHVGDSSVILGRQISKKDEWSAITVTKEHKPDSPEEMHRIHSVGGQVMTKAGIARVVWKRPRVLKGPVRRSAHVDNVPFLAIARSLGDLWSYDGERDAFIVSPEPDISVYNLEGSKHQCIILASDGVWNMIGAGEAVLSVYLWVKNRKGTEKEPHAASILVDLALDRWQNRQIRADNTSAIVVLLNPVVGYGNLLLNNCENQIADRLSNTWISPSKPCLLPLRQNLQTDKMSVGTHICEKSDLSRIRLSKEDRVGARWRKIKRKSLPGFRVRLLSSGSGDSHNVSNNVLRRYTLPVIRSKSFSSCPMSNNISDILDLCSLKSFTKQLSHLNKLQNSSLTAEISKDSLSDCHNLNTAASVPSLKASRSSSGSNDMSPVCACEPLSWADANGHIVSDSVFADDSASSSSPAVQSDMSLKSSDTALTAVALPLNKIVSSSCKRKSSDVEASLGKQPRVDHSYLDCSQTYRTRFHTRLRVSMTRMSPE